MSRAFPPSPGGVSDHTERWLSELCREWAARTAEPLEVTVVSAAESPSSGWFSQRRMHRWGLASMAGLLDAVRRAQPDLVVIQYVPQMYQRHGLSYAVNLFAAALRVAGVPAVTVAHELYHDRRDPLPRALIGLFQRAALVPLFWGSQRIVLTTADRQQRMQKVFPFWSDRFARIPVGSTIEPAERVDCTGVRHRLGVPAGAVLLFFLGLPHGDKSLRLLEESLQTLDRHGVEARLAVVGGARLQHRAAINLGFVGRKQVSSLLACADACLLPLADGVSGRRTSLANALASGRPLVGTAGKSTERALEESQALRLVPVAAAGAFAEAVYEVASCAVAERARRGAAVRELYDRYYGWPVLAREWRRLLVEASGRTGHSNVP